MRIFDDNLYKLRRLKQNLGNHHLYTSTLDRATLQEMLRMTDVVIGALRAENGRTPCVITEDMIKEMKPNSVIIDVSIDHGGCFETSKTTTHQKPTFKKHDVIHYCVPNIASRVAHTASQAISNVLMPLLLETADEGGIDNIVWHKINIRSGIYLFKGSLTNFYLSERFDLKFTDLNLLIASRR